MEMKTGSRESGPFSRRSGTTLLEVTLMLVVMTSLSLSVALIVVPVARQTRFNRELSTARAEAEKVLEGIRTMPFADVVEEYPAGSETSLPALPGGKVVVSYEDPDADPLVVRVDLSWTSAELGEIQRTFNTARTE